MANIRHVPTGQQATRAYIAHCCLHPRPSQSALCAAGQHSPAGVVNETGALGGPLPSSVLARMVQLYWVSGHRSGSLYRVSVPDSSQVRVQLLDEFRTAQDRVWLVMFPFRSGMGMGCHWNWAEEWSCVRKAEKPGGAEVGTKGRRGEK